MEYGELDGGRDDVEALVVVGEAVGPEIVDRFPALRVVANYGVGYDGIDVAGLREGGVAVTNTPGVLDAATADLTMALILAVRRRVVEGDRFVREGRWGSEWVTGELLGQEVSGATLGIVGLGRIGTAVARRARAFDMHVLYTRQTRGEDDGFRDLDDLMRESDIVSVHVPLTGETEGLIDAGRLSLLRDDACFVNTARGAVVDEPALVRELEAGRIRAGLDVFAHEPQVPDELLRLPNVVLTPHVGSATQETREAMTRVLVDNVLAVARGETPPNLVE